MRQVEHPSINYLHLLHKFGPIHLISLQTPSQLSLQPPNLPPQTLILPHSPPIFLIFFILNTLQFQLRLIFMIFPILLQLLSKESVLLDEGIYFFEEHCILELEFVKLVVEFILAVDLDGQDAVLEDFVDLGDEVLLGWGGEGG